MAVKMVGLTDPELAMLGSTAGQPQLDGRTLLLGKRGQRRLEGGRCFLEHRRLLRGRVGSLGGGFERQHGLPAPVGVDHLVAGDPVQPGAEDAAAVAAQTEERFEEDLVGHVLRQLGMAQVDEAVPVDRPDVPVVQQPECLGISPCRFGEHRIVGIVRAGPPITGRRHAMIPRACSEHRPVLRPLRAVRVHQRETRAAVKSSGYCWKDADAGLTLKRKWPCRRMGRIPSRLRRSCGCLPYAQQPAGSAAGQRRSVADRRSGMGQGGRQCEIACRHKAHATNRADMSAGCHSRPLRFIFLGPLLAGRGFLPH